jgi:plastocyanin
MTTELSPASSSTSGDRRDTATVFVFALAALALIVSVAAVGFGLRAIDESKVTAGSGESAAGSGGPVAVTLADFKIEPKEFSVAAGGTIAVTNDGATPHNLAIEGSGLRTEAIEPRASSELQIAGLAPGTYKAFCEIPGHREAGMEATVTVTEGAASSSSSSGDMAGMDHGSSSSASSGSSGDTMTADQMDEVMAAVTKKFPAATKGVGGADLAPTVLPDGTKHFELTASQIKWEVEPGKLVDAMAYNGTVPGPTIRVNPGDKVEVVLKNEMKESTALHIHGVELPNAMDGVPDITQPPIKPGASFTYAFTVQDTPAVGMYHSHHNAQVQVPNGLAGAFLIGREPVPAGVTVAQEVSMMLNDAGTIGFSLNGKSFPATAPYAVKQGDWVMVHYMNEGVMAHPMHLHGLPQQVIAKDGFPVTPYSADTINVAPGERYTVLVHATEPGVWAWHCHILPHAERSTGMFGMVTAMIVK